MNGIAVGPLVLDILTSPKSTPFIEALVSVATTDKPLYVRAMYMDEGLGDERSQVQLHALALGLPVVTFNAEDLGLGSEGLQVEASAHHMPSAVALLVERLAVVSGADCQRANHEQDGDGRITIRFRLTKQLSAFA